MFIAYATVQADIFKPTKFGGKYTVTLIPGRSSLDKAEIRADTYNHSQVTALVLKFPNP